MRFSFLNNFAQELAAPLGEGETFVVLDDNGELLENASEDVVYTLTLFDSESGENEIVYVTSADGNQLTVVRGREGTADRAWQIGTQVEMRLTAAQAGILTNLNFDHAATEIGVESKALGPQTLAAGTQAEVMSEYSAAFGMNSRIEEGAGGSTILGNDTAVWENCQHAVAVGYAAFVRTRNEVTEAEACTVIGAYSGAEGDNTTVCGAFSYSGRESPGGALFGAYAISQDRYTTALGTFSFTTAPESVAIGAGSTSDVDGGLHMRALGYLPKEVEDVIGMNQPPILAEAPNATRRAAQVSVIATDAIDLANANSSFTLDLPSSTIFLIDAIDIVVVQAADADGAPEIIVGPDDQDPDAYLAATEVVGTEVGDRQTHEPAVTKGVTNLRVAVDTAGTGTCRAKVVFRGYVMEV